MGSPHQTVNDLVGIAYWGESLLSVPGNFPGINKPKGINVIGTKWVFKNKLNEVGQVIRNKATLVCNGYSQVECVDFEEMSALVARLEAIRVFLAFACYTIFKLYQMDVKYAFLMENLKMKSTLKNLKVFFYQKIEICVET